MAGQKQPIDLLIAKGKKHLTKDEITNRKNSEISVPFLDISPPKFLTTKKTKDAFLEIGKKLLSIGIITELDEDCLGRYIVAQKNYNSITRKLNTAINSKNYDIVLIEKLSTIQDKFYKQCRSSANDLGLTISSRCRLILPQSKSPPPENKFKKFRDSND